MSTVSAFTFCHNAYKGGYPVADVDALGSAGYSGSSGGWVQGEFDLSAYADQTVVLRFEFASDGSVNEAGWAVDDLLIEGRKN